MALGTLEKVAAAISSVVQNLETRLNPDQVVGYFEQLGTRFPGSLTTQVDFGAATGAAGAVRPILEEFRTAEAANDTAGLLVTGAQLVGQLAEVFSALDGIATQIESQANSFSPLTPTQVEGFAAGFTKRVLDHAILRHLEANRPEYTHALVLLGLADRFAIPVVGANPEDPPVFSRELRLDRLADALSTPAEYLRTLVGWGDETFNPIPLLQRLEAFLNLFTISTVIDTTGGSPALEAGILSVLGNSTTSPPGIDAILNFPLQDGFSAVASMRPGYTVNVSITGGIDAGIPVTIAPPSKISVGVPATLRIESRLARTPFGSETAVVVLGQTGATRLEADAVNFSVGLELNPGGPGATGDFFVRMELQGARAVMDFSEGDGFLKSATGGSSGAVNADIAASWSVSSGLQFGGGGRLVLRLPLNAQIGPVDISGIYLSLEAGGGGFPLEISVTVRATLGPVQVVADRVGFAGTLMFPAPPARGNLGPADLSVGFKAPSGLGVSVDAGVVRGGGFLYIEQSRYFGAVELSVFGIAVKAFGLIETVLPDGTPGFSFAIIISAEFTPIQLGFGFTLLGVGGLVGINRTVNVEALGTAARTGSLAHLLFPRNVVQDAPAIVHDLATVFPAARGHYIFGPMAKFGWGTPTLITGSFGILIELPGPRFGLIGVVRMQLPDPQAAILSLQMAIQGFLDFPAKLLSVDAGLFDSFVAGFAVAGDMAYRLGFGNSAKFLMSIGGFNSDFDAPAGFPELRRASVELGVNGNPSLTASGYFALTSNTAQIGARVDLRASGFGIRLTGWLGFDALFVFSPFSFVASFSAGMRVSFHGAGIGVTLRGTLKGTNPWAISGKVCVSVLWWDACLSVDHTFGNRNVAALPEIDPWVGNPSDDPRLSVIGLRAAVADARNWSGSNPPAGFSVVSLARAATQGRTLIDPLGAATLRQKVAPLQEVITKFGEYKPVGHDRFFVSSVSVSGIEVDGRQEVLDDFAPAHFFELSNAEKLSMDSYQPMVAGFTINPDRTTVGSSDSTTVDYETDFITADGDFTHDAVVYKPSPTLLAGLLKGLALSKGIRRTGAQKYVTPNKPKKVTFGPKRFLVVDSCTSRPNTAILSTDASQIRAFSQLRQHVAANPADLHRYQVAPSFAAL